MLDQVIVQHHGHDQPQERVGLVVNDHQCARHRLQKVVQQVPLAQGPGGQPRRRDAGQVAERV